MTSHYRYGGKHVLGLGILLALISTLLIPVAARFHVYLVFVLRVLMGLGMVKDCSNICLFHVGLFAAFYNWM